MSPLEIQTLLERIAPDLEALTEPWTIIGSGALMILGFPVGDCPDIDILTTRKGAAQLNRRWAICRDHAYVPPAAPFRSQFSRYRLPEGPVEVMGDMLVQRPEGWAPVHPGVVERRPFGRRAWPVPSSQDQLRILAFFGRPKDLARAARLQFWLEQRSFAPTHSPRPMAAMEPLSAVA
jgi:hypothetical protein